MNNPDPAKPTQPIPIVIAHRGDLSQAAENTLSAIEAAIHAGVNLIECDIQLDTDCEPVLLHDADLKRTHRLNKSVFDISSTENTMTQPLNTLAQLLALLDRHPQVIGFLEIKHESISRWGAQTVLKQVLKLLTPERQRHVVITTNITFLHQVRSQGHHNIGCILRDRKADTHTRVKELAPDYLIINQRRIGAAPLWPGPWQWAAYEIGSVAQALKWAAKGVDYVISFNCGELHQQLAALRSET